jgi:hypothetical protein
MRFDKLKLITASTFIFLCCQSGNVMAQENTTSQGASQAAPSAEAPVAAQPQANTAQAPRPVHQGYPYRGYNRGYYRGYDRGYSRPFGSSGPSFRGPWNKGSGWGFSNDDGPGWGSGPSYGSWGDRDRGFYDRRPDFREPWDRGSGSGFGFSSNDGPGWDSRPGYDRGPGYRPWGDRDRGFYDRGPDFRGPWDRGNGSGMGFGW